MTKKRKKLDPDERFVVEEITRSEIAEMLNYESGAFAPLGEDQERFAPDDARLTGKVCRGIVEGLVDVNAGDEDLWDFIADWREELL